MARKRCKIDQDMADFGGQVPGTSVVSPDKSSSSSQAADDMAAPNQPTNNITASDSLMDGSPLLNESTDVTTVERQLIDVTASERQLTDVTTSERQLSDVTTPGRHLTDVERIADSRCKHKLSEYEYDGPDFSSLPLIIWLQIFSLLKQRDRLVLSVTCRTLHGVSRDCSVLWKSAVINMGGTPFNTKEDFKMSTTDRSVLREHFHQMSTVIIHNRSLWRRIWDTSSYNLLCQAAKQWPLKHLKVKTYFQANYRYFSAPSPVQHLLHTCVTSPGASQLASLKITIRDWPASGDGTSGLVEALKHSYFTSSLTHLHIGLITPYSRNYHYLGDLGHAIGRFENLRFLKIPYHYLCNSLLNGVPKQLKEIHFIVSTVDDIKDVTNWPQVLDTCPQLTVGLYIFGLPPFSILPHMFPPIVPVTSIRIKDLSVTCTLFQWTLLGLLPACFQHMTTLRCLYHDASHSLQNQLITVIRQSPKLDFLHFHGSISADAVLTIRSMREWRELDFDASRISFKDCKDRSKKVQELEEEVSKVLGASRSGHPQSAGTTPYSTHTNDTSSRPFSVTVQPGPMYV